MLKSFVGAIKLLDKKTTLILLAYILFSSLKNVLTSASLAFLGLSLIATGAESSALGGSSQLTNIVQNLLGSVGLNLTVTTSIVLSVVFFVTASVFAFLQVVIENKLSVDNVLTRTNIVKRVLHLDWVFVQTRKTGDIGELWLSAEELQRFYTLGANVISFIVEFAIYIVGSLIFNWQLTLLLVGLQLLNLLVNQVFVSRLNKIGVKRLFHKRKKTSSDIQILNNLKSIKSNALIDKMVKSNYLLSLKENSYVVKWNYLAFSKTRSNALFGFAILVGGIVLASFVLNLSSDLVLLYLILAQRLNAQLAFLEAFSSAFVDLLPSISYTLANLRFVKEHPERGGGLKPPEKFAGIELKSVSYAYTTHSSTKPSAKHKALVDASLLIPPKKVVALVGPSGAGKTTILDLIIGLLVPDKGQTLVGERDLNDYNLIKWREKISYVTQETVLYDGTIEDNLKFYNPNVSAKEIEKVLELVTLSKYVNSLPDGINSEVGERGSRLSGGQRQRLVLARSLLKRAQILVLDEATNQVDIENETKIHELLYKDTEFSPDSILIISHRTSSIFGADLIHFIKDGTVVESGSPEELVALKGYFFEYWNKSLGQIKGN